jgi:hypothetical protein
VLLLLKNEILFYFLEMAPPEQAQPKLMYPVVMSQQSMVSPSAAQYPVLMQQAQNMMYMVQSQYKKEDDYRQYQGPPPPMAGHSLYIGHTGYSAPYQPSQLYYPPVYMAPPQMQPELPPPQGPPEMYMPEPLNLSVAPPKEVMLPPTVLVNPETSILQPNAPAFLPTSYHSVQAKPPATFNSNLQLRPNAPAQEVVVKHEELEPEPPIVVIYSFFYVLGLVLLDLKIALAK